MEHLTDVLRAAWLRLRALLRPDVTARELDEEVRFHLEMEAERLVEAGWEPDEARREAMMRFGGVDRFKEQARDARGTRWVEEAMHDLRYALRMLVKNPVFSGVAILTLALGIGATTAIYTVVEAVLLEPLPFSQPRELVLLYSENQAENTTRYLVSPLDFDDWRSRNATFDGMAAYWPTATTLTRDDASPQRLQAVYTTEDFFEVMGASSAVGRTFTPDDGPGSTEVAVLSHGFWQREFGGDPSVVGTTMSLDGSPTEIVGVLSAGQTFPPDADVWLNMTWPMQIQSRFARWMSAVGRLGDPEGLDAARADMNRVAAGIARENPRTNDGWTVRVEPLRDELVGDTGRALWILLSATAIVLLIACANVANLLLSRSEVRASEIAVRTAFGAGRGRLARQLLTESLLLSGAGAVVGLGIAWLGVRGLLGLAPVDLPREGAVTMDGTILLVVLAVSVLTGILFGMAPIARLLGSGVQASIRHGARTTGSKSGHRLQNVFVVAQLALALMLVTGAGLLVRSFDNLQQVDTGFQASGVLTAELDLATSVAPTDTAVIDFYEQLRTRLAGLPGVLSVGDASSLPLGTDHDYTQPFEMDAAELPPDAEIRATFRPVSPGFFESLRVPVVEGRVFDTGQRLGDAGVAVVNESFVRRFLPDGNVLGVELRNVGFRYGPLGAIHLSTAEIIGVVADVKYHDLRGGTAPAIYVSGLQSSIRRRTLTVRTSGTPGAILPGLREAVEDLSGQVALTQVRSMDEVLAAARSRDRFSTLLLSLFGVAALVLASVGIYGVLAYAVAQRRGEVGIRMALGADRGRVRGMVLLEGLRLVGVGLALGLAGALALAGVLASQLYGVAPRDPVILATVTGILLAVGLLASLVPAWRATRVSPVVAMRGE